MTYTDAYWTTTDSRASWWVDTHQFEASSQVIGASFSIHARSLPSCENPSVPVFGCSDPLHFWSASVSGTEDVASPACLPVDAAARAGVERIAFLETAPWMWRAYATCAASGDQ